MEYKKALEYVHSIPKFIRPLGNNNLRRLLDCLGNPQEKLKFVHIAGTNGKGSTAAMIASVLKEQGYRTGLYTSPYIDVFNERIQMNGANISNETLSEYIWFVKDTMEKSNAHVSEFAFITAVAMVYFDNAKCDYVVFEAGMGGRYDATNVIDESIVSVITAISLDHTQYLGETIEKIAAEKCGIIRERGNVVAYPTMKALPVIQEECNKNHASLTVAKEAKKAENGFIYGGIHYPLGLCGEYQAGNAAVALETLFAMQKSGVRISGEAIKRGLEKVKWPARFEFVRENVIIDGAHNIDGILALKKSLSLMYKNVIVVMAMMADKAYTECVEAIASGARMFIATELDDKRCLSADKLAEAAHGIKADVIVETDLERAIETALKHAGNDELVCICGSLYLAGEARKIFSKNSLQN